MASWLASSVFRDTLLGFKDGDVEDDFQAACLPLSAQVLSNALEPQQHLAA